MASLGVAVRCSDIGGTRKPPEGLLLTSAHAAQAFTLGRSHGEVAEWLKALAC